jgi:hypothetical protein
VLEAVVGIGRHPALKDQLRGDELAERSLEFLPGNRRYSVDQPERSEACNVVGMASDGSGPSRT